MTKKEASGINVFELFATLVLDDSDYNKKLGDAAGKAQSVGSGIGGKLATGLKAAAKVGTAAITATGTAVVTMGKQSVEAYGNYEQLVGGVETLFGAGGKNIEEYAASVNKSVDEIKDEYEALIAAQTTVFNNAKAAYTDAGVSMNKYMEVATSTAAVAVSSLGGNTQAAAELVDMAIKDMSDNANKMGSDMTSVMNAYQGFSKQNYTMLDNLKLGYGGTKEEMERLLATANELNAQQGKNTQYQIDNYADIVEAIHLVQEQMGITGTTAAEASETIQGSISSAKAAWENWLTALGDENADLDARTDELVDTFETAFKNLLPVAERILESLGKVMQEKGPDVISKLAETLVENIPDIVVVAGRMAVALIDGLLKGIAKAAVKVKTAIKNLFGGTDTAEKESSSGETYGGHSGSFAKGLSRVPYDDFPARLHRNEAVLTASQADEWRSGNSRGTATYVTNNYNMTVDAKNVKEINDMARIANNRRVTRRMGVS